MIWRHFFAAFALLSAGLTLAAPAIAKPNLAQTRPIIEQKPADFPLLNSVRIKPIENFKTIRVFYLPAIRAVDIDESLAESFRIENLLVSPDYTPEYELTPRYISHTIIGALTVTSEVTIGYRLTRLADNSTVFDREITSKYTSEFNMSFSSLLPGAFAAAGAAGGAVAAGASQAQAAAIGQSVAAMHDRANAPNGATKAEETDHDYATLSQGPEDGQQRRIQSLSGSFRLNLKLALRDLVAAFQVTPARAKAEGEAEPVSASADAVPETVAAENAAPVAPTSAAPDAAVRVEQP